MTPMMHLSFSRTDAFYWHNQLLEHAPVLCAVSHLL
jgi:hypothetical protein